MQLCDVNIFIYAHREDAPNHAFYQSWLQGQLTASATFLYCEFILSAFVRITTHQKIFKPPTPVKLALEFAEQIRSSPNGVGIMPGATHWKIFSGLCAKSRASGNLIPDAYLAALAIEAMADWVTTDEDYKVFEPELIWTLLKP
ncbi:MAG: type II toxin-antitoxin system VapC family toxin [Hyphomicrobiaceae bacterium]|nr:MAG: type II toxin-antitoxin system VapC family toxin [Hyphomicrobiaceae bacterium]